MSIVIRCPHCLSSLRSNRPIPPGRSIPCPLCRRPVTDRGEPGTDVAPSSSSSASSSLPAGRLPTAKLLPSEEDSGPARPHRRDRIVSPPPVPPPPAPDPPELTGDVPPIPRSRKWLLPMAGCTVGLAGLVVMAVVLVFVLRNGCAGSPLGFLSGPRDADLLVWAPADTDAALGADLEDFFSQAQIREVFADNEYRAFRDAGFDIGSVQRVLLVARTNKAARFDTLLVVRLNRAYDPNMPIKTGRAKVKQKGSQKYLEFTNGHWLFNPTERVVLLTDREPLLLDAMSGNGADLRIGPDLLSAARGASGPLWGAAVGPAAQPDTRGYFPDLLRLRKNPDPHPLRLSETYSTRVTADGIEFTIVAAYSSPEKAKVAADQMDYGVKHALTKELAGREAADPELHFVRVVYDSLKIEPSRERVTIRFSIPHRELRRLKLVLK